MLNRFIGMAFVAALLSGCAPGMFEVKRGSTVPVIGGESWVLELQNDRAGKQEKLDVSASGSTQNATRNSDGTFEVRAAGRVFIILGADEVQFSEISVGSNKGVGIYSRSRSGKMFTLYLDASKVGVGSSSCSFGSWADDSSRLVGRLSIGVQDPNNSNVTQFVSAGTCTLARSR